MTPTLSHGRVSRLLAAAAVAALVPLPLTVPAAPAHAAAMASVTQVMNWFPEPEQGGYYTGQALNIYQKHGLDMKIVPFSFQMKVLSQVALGHITFGMVNADELFEARAQGIPVVAVMATFQDNPQCLMWHANDKSIKTLADLSNHTIIYSFGAGYFQYLKDKYHYKNIKEVNYDFTLRLFLATPNAVNQGYITSEPYTAQHGGHAVKAALIASSGFNPYGDVMITTEQEIKQHPDVVRAYVTASVEAWKAYYNAKNTEKVNAYMRSDPTAKNYPLTPDAMRYAVKASRPLVTGGAAKTHGMGYIDPARMTLLKKQLISVGIKVSNVDPASTFTDAFLPKM